MPGIPVAACGTSRSRSTDRPNHEDAYAHLSAEEKLAAEESLSNYCKPVAFYNELRRRAREKPLFLQRCLLYKREAKHNKRIEMTVSLSRSDEVTKTILPLYIGLARQDRNNEDTQYSSVHRLSKIFTFPDSSGTNGNTKIQANFRLPAVDKLVEKAGSGLLDILVFTNVRNPNSSSEVNSSVMSFDPTSSESSGEQCLYGKLSLELLYAVWASLANFSLGKRVEIIATVDLHPCALKRDFLSEHWTISIQNHCGFGNESTSKKVQLTISAEDFGAKGKAPYLTYASSSVRLSSSISRLIRLREGQVMFNYRYYDNKLQVTEATEDFICPFCLVSCESYKGLRDHLPASHDRLNFEFPGLEEFQTVNVSLKTNIWRFGIDAEGINPKLQTFFYCGKKFNRRGPENASFENANYVDPLVLESEIPAGDTEPPEKADENADGASNAVIVASNTNPDCVPLIPEYKVTSMPEHEVTSMPEHEVPSRPEHNHGTPATLSNAVIVASNTNPDCVPLIPEYEDTSMPEHEVPSRPEHNHGTPATLSNAVIVASNTNPDCVPLIPEYEVTSMPEHEVTSMPEYEVPSRPEHNHGTPATLQVSKKGKLPVEHSDSRSLERLEKRQFYHSRKAQPMAFEEVIADEDSEDEVEDDVRDAEGQKMLENFELSTEEKTFMQMWNTFVRKQRVRADGHIPWAYEAFSRQHASDLVQSPKLEWRWRLFMLKLWNHGLLDGRTMNKCSIILEEQRKKN